MIRRAIPDPGTPPIPKAAIEHDAPGLWLGLMEDKIGWYFTRWSDRGGTQKATDVRIETNLGTDFLGRVGLA